MLGNQIQTCFLFFPLPGYPNGKIQNKKVKRNSRKRFSVFRLFHLKTRNQKNQFVALVSWEASEEYWGVLGAS